MIVTGAARGVGLAIAERFVRAGASVVCADIDEARLEREVGTHRARWATTGRAQAFAGDLREKLAMTNLVAATLDANDGIDVLVNASRVLVASDPLNPEGDRLEATLAQNVTATLRLTQIVARRMIEIAGTEAARPRRPRHRQPLARSTPAAPRRACSPTRSSCAAIDQLTRTLALALAPAPHPRQRHRRRRPPRPLARRGAPRHRGPRPRPSPRSRPSAAPASPADFADAALFLASPGAAYVTGQVLAVDGGRALLDPLYASRP